MKGGSAPLSMRPQRCRNSRAGRAIMKLVMLAGRVLGLPGGGASIRSDATTRALRVRDLRPTVIAKLKLCLAGPDAETIAFGDSDAYAPDRKIVCALQHRRQWRRAAQAASAITTASALEGSPGRRPRCSIAASCLAVTSTRYLRRRVERLFLPTELRNRVGTESRCCRLCSGYCCKSRFA